MRGPLNSQGTTLRSPLEERLLLSEQSKRFEAALPPISEIERRQWRGTERAPATLLPVPRVLPWVGEISASDLRQKASSGPVPRVHQGDAGSVPADIQFRYWQIARVDKFTGIPAESASPNSINCFP